MSKLDKYIKFVPVLLLAIVAGSVFFYANDWFHANVYPYLFQIYPMLMLGALLINTIKQKHELYLKIIYVGLININILNCLVILFNIQNWMPWIIGIIITTIGAVLYFSGEETNGK